MLRTNTDVVSLIKGYGREADLLPCVTAQAARAEGVQYYTNKNGARRFGPNPLAKGGVPILDSDGIPVPRYPDGKIPSQFYGKKLGGIAWNEHSVATAVHIEILRSDPRYNIGLNTRVWKAIDVDISDADKVAKIQTLARGILGDVSLRTRDNSSRITMLVQCEEEYRKHVVSFGDLGDVEILGNGEQTVLHGTHKSGAAVMWDGHKPPVVIVAQLERFVEALQTELGGKLKESQGTGSRSSCAPDGPGKEHPVVVWLEQSEYFDGWGATDAAPAMMLKAPEGSEYTSEFKTGDIWLLLPTVKGLDGKPHREPYFKALHSHDKGRTYAEWLQRYGVPEDVIHAGAVLDAGFEHEGEAEPKKENPRQDAPKDEPFTGESSIFISGETIKPKAIQWIWPDYLAKGKFQVFGGRAGTGKTMIALDLAAHITTGRPWPDGQPCPIGNVVIWSGEDAMDDTLVPRLIAAGADLSRIKFCDKVPEDGKRVFFDPSRHMPVLDRHIRALGNVLMVIVEPLVMVVKKGGDSHKNAETRRDLAPLTDLAERNNLVVFGITHFTKGTSGHDPLERVTGSLAFGAAPRIVFASSPWESEDGKREDGYVFAKAKANICKVSGGGFRYRIEEKMIPGEDGGQIGAPHVVWGDAVEGSAKAILNKAEGKDKPKERGRPASALYEAKQWLIAFLLAGPKSAKDVEEAAEGNGLSWGTVRRAQKDLKIVPTQKDRVWMWALPEGFDDLGTKGDV